jgi:DNA-directed RNA polymerase specialized sigma24 family protein
MRRRCYDANRKDYRYYGGRGINVCERWESFDNFIADMGERPTPKHSIDRIDVNGSYSPENCRWATHTEQMRNVRKSPTRRRSPITFNGIEYPSIRSAAKAMGLNLPTFYARIRRGSDVITALTMPVDLRKSRSHA